jgi:hypothetical protein
MSRNCWEHCPAQVQGQLGLPATHTLEGSTPTSLVQKEARRQGSTWRGFHSQTLSRSCPGFGLSPPATDDSGHELSPCHAPKGVLRRAEAGTAAGRGTLWHVSAEGAGHTS